MCRNLFAFLFSVFLVVRRVQSEQCEVSSTGEFGECVVLQKCEPMIDLLTQNRSHPVTICSKELRQICCPLNFMTKTSDFVTEKVKLDNRNAFESDLVTEVLPESVEKCRKYRWLLFHNETINSFTLGEPAFVNSTPFCNQKRENNGIASEKEFPNIAIVVNTHTNVLKPYEFRPIHFHFILIPTFKLITSIIKLSFSCRTSLCITSSAIHLSEFTTAIIKLQSRILPRDSFESETKCVGSLISERHVLTSVFCVSSDRNFKVSVQLGTINYSYEKDSDPKDAVNSYEVEEIDAKYGVSILKLKKTVNFNDRVMPICLFPESLATSEILLTGWSGDWRECDPTLKKWVIDHKQVEQTRWHLSFAESSIINYRQSLLAGSPLQVYHPDKTCQYSLVGVFEQLTDDRYSFNGLHKKLRWIESIVWPKRLQKMHEKTYQILRKGLRVQ